MDLLRKIDYRPTVAASELDSLTAFSRLKVHAFVPDNPCICRPLITNHISTPNTIKIRFPTERVLYQAAPSIARFAMSCHELM